MFNAGVVQEEFLHYCMINVFEIHSSQLSRVEPSFLQRRGAYVFDRPVLLEGSEREPLISKCPLVPSCCHVV